MAQKEKEAKANRKPETPKEAIDKLGKLGVITAPGYWEMVVEEGGLQYLDKLFIQAANRITRKGTRCDTADEGIEALRNAGVINTPEYWQKHAHGNVDFLLRALGGAVAAERNHDL